MEKIHSLNRVDRILHFYLKLVNGDLLMKLKEKKELRNIIANEIATLFTKDLNSDNIIYFWDCIFVNEQSYTFEKPIQFEDNFLHFVDFIALATLVLNKENADKSDFEQLYLASLHNLDGKEIVKRAIKLREKVNTVFSDFDLKK